VNEEEVPPSRRWALLAKCQQDPATIKRRGLEEEVELPLFIRQCPTHLCPLDQAEESDEGELRCPGGGEWLEQWNVVRMIQKIP
jgi:hypothetical protein